MNPYAIPAFVATILLYTLELVGWLFRTRERVNVAFALFTGAFGTDALINFLFLQFYDHPNADNWVGLAVFSGTAAIAGTIYFILVLTGYDKRMDARFYGLKLRYLLAVICTGISLIVIFSLSTDWIVTGIRLERTGLHVTYGEYSWLFSVLLAPLPLTVIALLSKAIRDAEDNVNKRFLHLNAIGLAVLIIAQPLFEVLLVHFDYTGQFLSYVGAAIGAIFFLIAIVRHQFDRIEELNLGLEQKVADRTRHLRDAQARLVQSEKTASLAHLVAGVAHEFNTPLGAVMSSVQTAKDGITRLDELIDDPDSESNRDRARKTIKSIQTAGNVVETGADRISTMVNRLKSFAHLDEPELQTFDVHRGIDDSIEMLPRGWELRVTIERQYGDLPLIIGYPVLVNQVIFNSLTNAIESINDEGFIRLETKVENDHAVITIADNGSGIAEEHLERVYDPGFTTKGPGVGMGLGLAIAHNVMEQHQGEIEVHSLRGEGTTLVLRFPLNLTPEQLNRKPFSAEQHEATNRDLQE